MKIFRKYRLRNIGISGVWSKVRLESNHSVFETTLLYKSEEAFRNFTDLMEASSSIFFRMNVNVHSRIYSRILSLINEKIGKTPTRIKRVSSNFSPITRNRFKSGFEID